MATTSPVQIDAPALVPPLGGLLAVAQITDSTDPHVGMGVEYYTYLCDNASGIAPGMCEVADGVIVDGEKQWTGGRTVTVSPFAIYAGVICDLLGRPYDDLARVRLGASEELLISRAFFQTVWAGGFDAATQVMDSVEDVCEAIGALEQYAAVNYLGRPVLHMNRHTATCALAADVAYPQLDGTLATGQGTPIANAPGYPDDFIFITGQVNAWRTPVNTMAVDDVMNNQALAVAERIYSVGSDCLLAWAGVEPVAVTPTVTDVTPDEGPTTGGQRVTITGSGFQERVQ